MSGRRWRRVVAALGLALACANAPAVEPLRIDADAASGSLTDPQRQAWLARIAAIGRRGFLYDVTPPVRRGQAPSGAHLYLYGSIHLGRDGIEPFNAPVFEALRRSSRLVLEADPSDAARVQALVLRMGRYEEGDDLSRHVPPALLARVEAFGRKRNVPAEQLRRFRPWMLANMVALSDFADAGLDASMGTEMYLAGFARSLGMPIVEIEGMANQLRLLADLPDDLQAAQLDEALADLDAGTHGEQSRELYDIWVAGDRAGAERWMARTRADAAGKPFERHFLDVLIDDRNRTMADAAEAPLKGRDRTFFAVGALHLFGQRGLIAELQRRGYRVRDLQTELPTR